MSSASLAARYRPQTFAQVVGQDMVKSILSRAAQEDRVAPAYLLSGTRGVGKTTVARIFAKALNCRNAPTGEPCNECEACRRITQGGFVDVVEIDGASNRGIDDVRRLRDAVGYAPLEGRYKVFIIDEAHMLTKEAFNALLKTLEEPPARVTFIMATTEQHRFPVTIVSRCQHFVFRQIPEATLEAHLVSVLEREGRPFEAEAARLIARRAAGSVRDSMSLLGQVLALGEAEGGDQTALTAAQTRDVLGLAGQEVMERLLNALAEQNALAVSALVRELLLQGADMGFFLRELGTLWRNLFLLRQAGATPSADGLTAALDLPEREIARLRAAAERFPLSYIHAAWQMTLDGQRRILTSLEPSAGLELLLLNLAMLPRLLPLAELDPSRTGTPTDAGGTGGPGGVSSATEPVGHAGTGAACAEGVGRADAPASPRSVPGGASREPAPVPSSAVAAEPAPKPVSDAAPVAPSAPLATGTFGRRAKKAAEAAPAMADEVPAYLSEIPSPAEPGRFSPVLAPPIEDGEAGPAEAGSRDPQPAPTVEEDGADAPVLESAESEREEASQPQSETVPAAPAAEMPDAADAPVAHVTDGADWQEFLLWLEAHPQSLALPLPMLRQFDGQVRGEELVLRAHSQTILQQVRRPTHAGELENLVARWAGRPLRPVFLPPEKEHRTEAELRAEMQDHPVIKSLQELYDATLLKCTQAEEDR